MYETHSGDKKLEMQIDNVFAKNSASSLNEIDITAAPVGPGFEAGGGKRKSIRKKHRNDKPYNQSYIQASASVQLEIVHAKKNGVRDEYIQLHMDVLR